LGNYLGLKAFIKEASALLFFLEDMEIFLEDMESLP
jgi:hypothetical protein